MLPQKQADMPVPKGQVVPGAGQGTQPAATPAAAPSTEPAAQPAAQNVPTMPPANSSHKLTPPTAPPPPPVGDEAAGAVEPKLPRIFGATPRHERSSFIRRARSSDGTGPFLF